MAELVSLTGEDLDMYLANGWFRMNQTVFTTNFEWLNNSICVVIWLRVRLKDFEVDKKYKELYRKNKNFDVEFTPAAITDQQEELFSLYKESKPFEASASLRSLLYGDKSTNVYNTWMINVYDQSSLVGSGFFDLGKNSAAGITSFYHPGYAKNSLGLFIIYQKMLFCKSKGLEYFYPGYFSPDYSAFDYKLRIGKSGLEYYAAEEKEWFLFYQKNQ